MADINRPDPKSPTKKRKTRDRIMHSTLRILRSEGIAAASVAQVMKGAGLTIGGFYAHFPAKSALIDEALRSAMKQTREPLLAGLDPSMTYERVDHVMTRYLSRFHRDHPESGCPLPAVVSEIAHRTDIGRDALIDEVLLTAEQTVGDPSLRAFGLGILALMYGGLSLARALRGSPLSDEVLQACRMLGRAAMRGAGIEPTPTTDTDSRSQ